MSSTVEHVRFLEFKLKFDEILHHELQQNSKKSPLPSCVVNAIAIKEEPLEDVTERAAESSNSVPEKRNLSSSSSAAAEITVEDRYQPDQVPDPKLSDFASAKQIMTDFFENTPRTFHRLNVRFKEKKAEAINMLKTADNSYGGHHRNLLEVTSCWKFKKLKQEIKRRNHEIMLQKMREKSVKSVLWQNINLKLHTFEQCESLEEVGRLIWRFPSLFESTSKTMKSIGTEWKDCYRKLKGETEQEWFDALTLWRQYKEKMSSFVNNGQLCVDAGDFEREEVAVLASLGAPPSNLQKHVDDAIQQVKALLIDKVLSNGITEEACVRKAVDHACDKYEETMAARVKNWKNLEDLHSLVYSKIRKCFESVPDFEYTKLWRWPLEEPQKIKLSFEKTKEQRNHQDRIKAQAAHLLQQLDFEEQKEFLLENFKEHVTGLKSAFAGALVTAGSKEQGPASKRAKMSTSTSAADSQAALTPFAPASRSSASAASATSVTDRTTEQASRLH